MEECSRIEAQEREQQTRDRKQVPPPGAHPIIQYRDPTQVVFMAHSRRHLSRHYSRPGSQFPFFLEGVVFSLLRPRNCCWSGRSISPESDRRHTGSRAEEQDHSMALDSRQQGRPTP
ncbi:hypothetical protein fugu_018406 [Takifugu bimaculatus]|uniref:Uncharacterized protein n=1 Tax=Takifugu bimaculatus TaxID=433685 RepID=A0A4Z2BL17_9TELE|nr:hypothetical protein fugu_018406 [Takifugu bimaculatus]